MADIIEYLKEAVSSQASDLFLVAGAPVSVKQDKHLRHLTEEKIFPQETRQLIEQIYQMANRPMDEYLLRGWSGPVPGEHLPAAGFFGRGGPGSGL